MGTAVLAPKLERRFCPNDGRERTFPPTRIYRAIPGCGLLCKELRVGLGGGVFMIRKLLQSCSKPAKRRWREAVRGGARPAKQPREPERRASLKENCAKLSAVLGSAVKVLLAPSPASGRGQLPFPLLPEQCGRESVRGFPLWRPTIAGSIPRCDVRMTGFASESAVRCG